MCVYVCVGACVCVCVWVCVCVGGWVGVGVCVSVIVRDFVCRMCALVLWGCALFSWGRGLSLWGVHCSRELVETAVVNPGLSLPLRASVAAAVSRGIKLAVVPCGGGGGGRSAAEVSEVALQLLM